MRRRIWSWNEPGPSTPGGVVDPSSSTGPTPPNPSPRTDHARASVALGSVASSFAAGSSNRITRGTPGTGPGTPAGRSDRSTPRSTTPYAIARSSTVCAMSSIVSSVTRRTAHPCCVASVSSVGGRGREPHSMITSVGSTERIPS